jgi:hypothetical protein
MIPKNRPIIGHDLEDIRLAHGISTADACWLFGMSPTKWTHVARQGANNPVVPALAILVRVLDENPSLRLIPKMPDANEIMAMVGDVTHIDKRRLSVMMGNEASGGYRWITLGARQPPLIQRIFYCLRQLLMMSPVGSRADVVNDWFRMVEMEAMARGVSDVFRSGSWTPDSATSPKKAAAPGVAAVKVAKAKAGAAAKPTAAAKAVRRRGRPRKDGK